MSKLICLSIAVLLWALSVCAIAADGPYYMHAAEVNLRETPNGEILLELDLNDKIFIIEREGNWSYVSAPGRDSRGWVWTDYVGEGRVTASGEAEATAQPEPRVNTQVELPRRVPPATAGMVAVELEPDGPAVEGHITELVVADTTLSTGAALEVYSYDGSWTPPPMPSDAPPLGPEVDSNFEQDTPALTEQTAPAPTAAPEVMIESNATGAMIGEAQSRSQQPLGQFAVTTPGELASASEQFLPVGGHDIALISGSNVNVRHEANLKSEVLGRVNSGDKVYVVTSDDPWYFVSVPARDIKGWVFGEYVSELPRVEISGDEVRLREEPNTDGRIKSELFSGEVFYEFERKGGWVLCASSASGLKGWVHGDYVSQTDRSASRPYKVTGDGVNFRVSPEVDSVIISALDRGQEVAVMGRNEKWSFIEYRGQQGWMYSQYLDPNFKNAPKAVFGNSIGGRLIERAYAMEGTPYVWGGESNSGVDCSGFIYKLLLEEGADASGLPRRASTQMAGLGQAVDKEDLDPGDLVFFTTYKAGASHVGIYLGDGDFIHASSAQGKVTISNMSEGYYKRRFVGARRITEDELRRLQ